MAGNTREHARESFGIHDAAYRVGRAELLEWLNATLDLRYTKVEQCGNTKLN
jgi:outer membrane protein TolC